MNNSTKVYVDEVTGTSHVSVKMQLNRRHLTVEHNLNQRRNTMGDTMTAATCSSLRIGTPLAPNTKHEVTASFQVGNTIQNNREAPKKHAWNQIGSLMCHRAGTVQWKMLNLHQPGLGSLS